MTLTFQNWVITKPPGSLGYQYDNDSQVLTLGGTLPEGYTWDALVQSGQNFDVWNLQPSENGPTITLSEDNLANTGEYYVQIRGTNGEVVQHTNIVSLYVPRSLVGPGTWPTLPTEFAQAEKNIKELNAHPPIPGENGFWLLWDLETSAYIESQLSVPVGPAGPANTLRIGTVKTLEPGQAATAQITGEAPNQTLSLGIPRGQTGRTGATPALEIGQVETLEPDQPATAEFSGTPEKPVLSLGIPQGPPGQDGVQLNDSAINTTEAWSSKKIVDTLCPSFSVSGNPVTCNPVEDYPLSAAVTLEPKQAGTGDPSPENVRPISGWDSVNVTVSNESESHNYNLTLPETIYGGTVDVVTGEGEKTANVVVIDGETIKFSERNTYWNLPDYCAPGVANLSAVIKTSAFPNSLFKANEVREFVYTTADVMTPYFSTVEELNTFCVTQYAAGTPVTIVYQLATPEPFEVTPQPILALPGGNTLYTDGDSLEVSGRRDLLSTLEDLQHTLTAVTNIISEGGLT